MNDALAARTLKKISWRIVLLIMFLYFIACIDRVNVVITVAKPPLWSMPTMFLSGPAAATGIATINSIGNLGGFVGPAMIGWIKATTGSFAGGLYFVAGLLIVSAALTLVLARSVTRPAAVGGGAVRGAILIARLETGVFG